MPATGARGAIQLSMAARPGLRTHSIPRLFRTPRTIIQRTFRTRSPISRKPFTSFTFSSHARPSLLQRLRSSFRSFHSSRARLNGKPTPNPNGAAEPEPQTLGARMKKLSREYGWSALGVYLALSALDFPFCYLLVRYLGTDKIGEWEHQIVSNVKEFIPESVKNTWHNWSVSLKKAKSQVTGAEETDEHADHSSQDVHEAGKKSKASLATQLALAYALHKSFIFVRVPLTAALTPKVVKVLRGWGWDIGKRTSKEAKAIKRAANSPKSA